MAVLICLGAYALLLTQWEAIREHKLYFTEVRKDVSFPIGELSEAWSENTLRQRFADVPLHCYPNPGEGLGDRACVMDTRSYNGIPALFISFFFSAGSLQQVSINVPWWNHRDGYAYLRSSIGTPTVSQLLPHSGVRLHGWRLADGAGLFYNRDRSFNPLEWNAIYWRSASACAADGCFTRKGDAS